jgi:hypothetical protein
MIPLPLSGKPLTAATMVGGVTFTAALYLYMIEPEQAKPAEAKSPAPPPLEPVCHYRIRTAVSCV